MRYYKLLLALFLFSFVSSHFCAGKKGVGEKNRIQQIILSQTKRYPKMEIQDLYKLLHQSAFGSEHAVKDSVKVFNWLEKEWSGLDNQLTDPFIDTISADGSLVRVNLRPYRAMGLDRSKLLSAFINTATNYKGTDKDLENYWSYAEELCGKIPFAKEDMQRFFKKMKALGFPAVHHSKTYEDFYRPAYRVVLIKELFK